MEKKVKKSRLDGVPAWALSLITFFVPIGLWILAELIQIPSTFDEIIIIAYVIIVVAACFFICKAHPKSVWYTPVICNGFILFFVIKDAISWDEWTSLTDWLVMVGIVVLSVIAAIFGARIGQRKLKQEN